MTAELAVGTELGGYRIERVLGRGGMSVLYVAQDLTLGRKVALKVIAPELAGDAAFRERFIRESRIAASIDHPNVLPNVLPIHRAGEEDGTLFMAMRLVDGTDLRTIIDRDGALGVERAVSIVTQVAAALDAAHARGPDPPRRQAGKHPGRGVFGRRSGPRLPVGFRTHQTVDRRDRDHSDRLLPGNGRLRRAGAVRGQAARRGPTCIHWDVSCSNA
jgi:serine/threonine protein kinase